MTKGFGLENSLVYKMVLRGIISPHFSIDEILFLKGNSSLQFYLTQLMHVLRPTI